MNSPITNPQPANSNAPIRNKWPKRIVGLIIAVVLMGGSFALGVVVTAILAFRLMLPLATANLALGALTTMSQATTNALYTGDSATRLQVLTQLEAAFNGEQFQQIDPAVADWFKPAFESCRTDQDANVVAAADRLIELLDCKTEPPPR